LRVPVTARINVSSQDTQAAMNLADLSMGGFSIRSTEALPVGQVMRFMFAAPTSPWVVSLTARAIYARPDAGGPSDAPSHQTGFQFINDDSPGVQARIHQLLEHATAAVTIS
jgi:PilZ domain